MSQCEDVELKDLVTEALEKNGVLAKIRAQLRANIFMTLEDENGQKHQNPKLKSVFNSQFGFLAFLLIQELLDFCSLVQTASVFKSESGQGFNYIYEGRDVLLKKHLKFVNISKNNCDVPVLVHLIKMLFEFSKTSQQNNAENVNSVEEKSFESECALIVDPQNNTFVINSGRSDNYDLSFVSDADSSGSSVEKKKLSLNLTNSTVSSESIATELNENKQKSVEYGKFQNSNSESEHSNKQDGDSQDSSRVISEVVLNDESLQENTTSSEQIKTDLSVKSLKESKDEKSHTNKTNSSNSSYSQYFKEKQNSAKQVTSDKQQNKQLNVNQDGEPLDIVMRHVIQSRLNEMRGSEEEESLSEEMQAFEKSVNDESNGVPVETSISIEISEDNSVKSDDTVSPVRNILDETLPESPKTKQRVVDNINNLKMQSLRITDDDQIILCDGDDLKQKNLKNNRSNKNNLSSSVKRNADVLNNKMTIIKIDNMEKVGSVRNDLSIASNTNALPLYTNSSSKTSVIVNRSDVKRDADIYKSS